MERFGELLFETMNDTIRQVFGKSASTLIYRLMERRVSLKREEVGKEFEAFYAFLESCLVQKERRLYKLPASSVCASRFGVNTRR